MFYRFSLSNDTPHEILYKRVKNSVSSAKLKLLFSCCVMERIFPDVFHFLFSVFHRWSIAVTSIISRFSWHGQLEKIEDSIEFIKSRPRPLTIYAFTKSKTLERRMISETSSGSVVFNDAIIQVSTLRRNTT